MKNNPNALARGFTFLEMMVTVAILGLLAVLTVPKLMEAFNGAKIGTADGLQGQIQAAYDQWTSLGATHTTLATSGVDDATLTKALLDQLTSDPDSTVGNFTPIAVGSDPIGINEVHTRSPHAGVVRFKLPKAYLLGTAAAGPDAGQPGVVYSGEFDIVFKGNGTSRNSGTWTVTARP